MGTTFSEPVVVVGAGPTGLVLAAELALAGVPCTVVERRGDQSMDGSRAGGLYPRTLEVLAQRGVADRFVAAGQPWPVLQFGGLPLDVTDLPSRHPHVLALWQREIEPILAAWVAELGVTVRYGEVLVDLHQDPDGVELCFADGRIRRAAWVVGCDGGRSRVRRSAGIEFAGLDPTTSWLLAEADLPNSPELGLRHDRFGMHGIGRVGDEGPVRIVLTEAHLVRGATPTLGELRDALVRVYGTDFGLREARWISRFTDQTRQAVDYRRGRVLVAGDAAHVHPPHGGQGLNTGVQDAVNLGWKLAQVVQGRATPELLDTYGDERHPVAARVLRTTMVLVALTRPDERHQAVQELLAELVALDEARRLVTARQTGLDVAYDLGGDHPLVGRRVPDAELDGAAGPTTVFEQLHTARPLLLLRRGAPTPPELGGAVRHVVAGWSPTWTLPVVGEVDVPDAVLVRPDGHVAWVGAADDPGLVAAATRWFGGPTQPGDAGAR